ncbi:MAG: DUF3089 domain-containing protein [Lachnospiraceae bacterium]|nr:DUF3089 domain-containing protein [Lachnospiraceae bacterium]
MSTKGKTIILILLGMCLAVLIAGKVMLASITEQKASDPAPDYSSAEYWAYFAEGDNKEADLFLIAPTVDVKQEHNMKLTDKKTMENFLGALNMERGIYEDVTRMYAPYYRQAAMQVYSLTADEREPYLERAYRDVSAAFEWYLENENDGRPIILAGFSQGADMCYRLMKEYFTDEEMTDRLIAVYAIGWPFTEEDAQAYPQLRQATCEDDTGVIITFDCEGESVLHTFICPAGSRCLSINPLSWSTDTEPADSSLNLGACFTDYSGNITSEVPEFCGCYIDSRRGVVKVTGIDPADYINPLSVLPDQSYHIYDYQFFYRNLQENVRVRTESYFRAA